MAAVILSHSLSLGPGETVLISGDFVAESLILSFCRHAMLSKARPIVRLIGDLCRETRLDCNGRGAKFYVNPLKLPDGMPLDCSIGIWSNQQCLPLDDKSYEIGVTTERDQQAEFLQFAAEGRIRWVAAVYPTEAGARRAGMTLEQFRQLVHDAGMLDAAEPTVAWSQLSQRQQALCDFLEHAREVRLISSNGTDLVLGVRGRKWINGDGHFNFPDGEVFTAPVEDEIEGVFCSSFPVVHEGNEIDGVRLRFSAGRILEASATKGEETLIQMIRQDQTASIVGEVGLGTNYRIRQATGTSLLDEKIGGTIHIALGAAYPETGGTNRSSIHRDFVADLRSGGSIQVDGRPISEDGRFLNGDWPQPECRGAG